MRHIPFALVALCLLSAQTHASEPSYRLVPLGDLPGGGQMSSGMALNNLGEAVGVGTAEDTGYGVAPFRRDGEGITRMDQALAPDLANSILHRINDAGRVVGSTLTTIGYQAAVWDGTAPRLMGYVGGCGSGLNSAARGVSEAGVIVGSSTADTCRSEAFLWEDGVFTLLPLAPAESRGASGEAISPGGRYVGGVLWTSAGEHRPFAWIQGEAELRTLPAPLGGGYVSDVNDAGQLVGSTAAASGVPGQGIVWTQAGDYRLISPTRESHDQGGAVAINAFGEVVGKSFGGGSGDTYLWTEATGALPLASLVDESGAGWALHAVEDINDLGHIVGSGSNPQGQLEGYVLIPLGGEEGVGACCLGEGRCALASAARCEGIGGIFHDTGSRCEEVACAAPPPRGACCLDMACEILDPATCAEGGGFYHGAGVSCGEDPCTPSSCSLAPGAVSGGEDREAGALPWALLMLLGPTIFLRRRRL